DEPRQTLRPRVTGNQSEVDLGLRELGRVSREAQRARHRQLAAAAERKAVDRRDYRFAEVLDHVEHVLTGERVLAAAGRRLDRELVDVSARDERLLAGPGQDD